MLHRDTSPPRVHVPPPAALPCVWMSAGLVAFKLCDREGECEACPFDRAMRGLPFDAVSIRRSPSKRPVRRRTGRA
jgi:hypothetical protein